MTAITHPPPQHKPAFNRRAEFINGAKDTIPLLVGAAPFGIIFGALAINAGLSPAATLGLSLFVYAGSAQFIAVGLVAQGVGVLFIILTTFIVNLRHALYAASIAPYVKHLSQTWLLPLAFWLTDETYAVTIRRYPEYPQAPYKHWYQLGSSLSMYVNWQLCTVIGIIAGTQLDGLAEWGLDFAMVVTFVGIVVPLIINRPMLVCAVVSAGVALLANDMPNKLGIMVAAFVGIAAGLLVEMLQDDGKPKNQIFEPIQQETNETDNETGI